MSSDNNKVYGAATAVMSKTATYFKEVTSSSKADYSVRNPTFSYDDLVAGTANLTNETTTTLTDNSNTSAYTLSYTGNSANPSINGQFVLAEFTLGYKVPARTEYVVSYKFEIAMQRSNSATPQGCTVDLFMFGETDTKDCGSLSGNSLSFTAPTTSPYAVLMGSATGSKAISDSYTTTVTYSNRSDKDTTMTTSFAFKAGNTASTEATNKTYWKYCTCTATPNVSQINDLWLEAPANVSTDYTGTAYTDSNLNTISSITSASWYDSNKMTLSLVGGTAQDAGDYSIEVALVNNATTDDPWKLSNGTFSHSTQTIKFTINKVTPTVSFGNASTTDQYTADGTQDEFPNCTASYNGAAVSGTLNWGSQTPEGSASGTRKSYNYTFTPDDTTNYNTVSSSISLNYLTATINTITVTIENPTLAVYESTPKNTLVDDFFKVMVKYNGIAESKEVKSYDIIGWEAGDNVSVNIMIGSAMSAPVIIPTIGIDKIDSLTAIFTQGSNKITPDTTGDDLKPMLTVYAQWNYNPTETKTLAAADYDVEFTPVVGTNASTLTVKYTNSDNTEVSATPTGKLTVTQEVLNTSGVSVVSSTAGVTGSNGAYSCTYDPAVTVAFATSGNVTNSKGDNAAATATITYKKWDETTGAWVNAAATDLCNAGKYKIIATYAPDDTTNYTIPAGTEEVTATLTINKADYPSADKIEFKKQTVTHDNEDHSLVAKNVPAGVTVTYVYNGTEQSTPFEFANVNETGYSITAKFAHTNANYNDIDDITALLIITDKNTYTNNLELQVTGAEGSGNSYTATYSTDSAISFTLGGKLLDKDGAEVTFTPTYVYEKEEDGAWVTVAAADLKKAGTYRVTISVATGDPTYAEIDDLEVTLTIAKADLEVPADTVTDGTAVSNGQPHKVEVARLPDGVAAVEYEYTDEATGKTVKTATPPEFINPGDHKVKVYFILSDDENYNAIEPVEVTLKISDAVIVEIKAELSEKDYTTANTLDELKAKLTVTAVYNNGTTAEVEDYELSCDNLRDGKFKFGLQKITVKYTDADGNEFSTFVEIEVAKVKVALPTFKGGLNYTGVELKPKAENFNGYNADLMTFVVDKTVSGLTVGSYKAVFALNDPENYEWATSTTLKKTVFALTYDEVVLNANEAAVDWNISKAVLTATKTEGGLPVFASESFIGAFADVVTLKYYKDEACTEEIAAADLAYETQYYVKAELLDTDNFELDTSAAQYTVKSFTYTTPAKELTVWDKIVKFVVTNWLWLVIAVVALILFITIIALIARAAKKKRIREELAEQRRLEKEEREREERKLEREERMARLSQQQAMPQMMMPQMMPQMPQMPMQQSMPQQAAQPVAMGGGSSSEIAELKAELKAEFLAIKVDQNSKDIAANEIARLRDEVSAMRNEMTFAKRPEQISGMPVDVLTEALTVALKNVLGGQALEATKAEQAKKEETVPVAAQVPPDAIMTTVTTTKIDTTKKPAQSAERAAQPAPAGRTVVRNFVAPMPVDDGRVFDVGGFYKPADPLTDLEPVDDEKDE